MASQHGGRFTWIALQVYARSIRLQSPRNCADRRPGSAARSPGRKSDLTGHQQPQALASVQFRTAELGRPDVPPVPQAFWTPLHYQAEGLHADLAGQEFFSKCRNDWFRGLPACAIAKRHMRIPRLAV